MRKISFKTSYEDLISRIPGLFAYVERDEYGIVTLHKATDSPMGCYGKIVENIQIPRNISFIDGDNTIIESGKIYRFKYLMRIYYQYVDNNDLAEKFNNFKTFIEKGIGKINVEYDGLDRKESYLVPDFIYLVNVASLYEEMLTLSRIAEFYDKHIENKDKEIDKETEVNLCCKKELYKSKGGKGFLDFLESHLDEAVNIAKEYCKYAKLSTLTINYPINLFTTERDLGMISPLNSETVTMSDGQHNIINKKQELIGIKTPIDFKTDSKLVSLHRFKNYINVYDEIETPDSDKDWLFYYRKGQIFNMERIMDDFGNIETIKTKIEEIQEGNTINDLKAFGDVIEDIILDEKNKTIKIIYWLGVHLKAKCNKIESDEDKNIHIYYDNFEIDKELLEDEEYGSEYHGVRYEETYPISKDSELLNFFDGKTNLFNEYISGVYDDISDCYDENGKLNNEKYKIYNELQYKKFEFSIINHINTIKKNIDGNITRYDASISDKDHVDSYREYPMSYEEIKKEKNIFSETPLNIIREEFYEGITYPVIENFDVNINRGVSSVFEKHIRFSEVKTLQDIEEGSFFKIQEI